MEYTVLRLLIGYTKKNSEGTDQAGKDYVCGQPCEESIYEIKEQIGRQEIYKQNRTEQNSVRGFVGGKGVDSGGLGENCNTE
jgi:hypothetical protein